MAAKAAAAGSAPSAGVTRPTRRPPSRPGSRSAASVPAATSLATATAGTIEHPEPQLDQLLQHLHAAHLHGHRRDHPPPRQLGVEQGAGAGGPVEQEPGERQERLHPDLPPARQRMAGRDDCHLLLARQRLQPQPPGQRAAAGPQVGRQGQGHHPDVHGPLRHPPGGGRRGPVVEPQVDAGVAGAEGGDHRRQEVAGQGVAGAHHQPPLPQLRERPQPLPGPVHLVQDPLGPREQRGPGRAELGAPSPAGEEARPQILLQARDQLRDGRLRAREPRRRPGEAALAGHLHEGAQLVPVERQHHGCLCIASR